MLRLIFQTLIYLFSFSSLVIAQSDFSNFFKNSTQYQDVVVVRVIRTDLVELESGEKIRLIGLKSPYVARRQETPERDKYGFVIEEVTPLETVEELAFNYVRELLLNEHVRLEFDTEKKDADHNTFAYMFLIKDDVFVNTEILRQGYANLQIQPPNLKYSDQLRAAYKEAFKERRGLQNR